MDMQKLLTKVALITLGAIMGAVLLIFSLWILISPQSMASLSEDLGNYSFAVTCADLKYKYSHKTEDLARCVEDSILAKKNDKIVKYGDKLLASEDFEDFCAYRDKQLSANTEYLSEYSYRTYMLSTIALAEYRAGDLQKAVQTANRGEKECFRKLALEVVICGTAEDREDLLKFVDPTIDGVVDLIEGILRLK